MVIQVFGLTVICSQNWLVNRSEIKLLLWAINFTNISQHDSGNPISQSVLIGGIVMELEDS